MNSPLSTVRSDTFVYVFEWQNRERPGIILSKTDYLAKSIMFSRSIKVLSQIEGGRISGSTVGFVEATNEKKKEGK